MENLNRKQWQIFEITCVVVLFVLVVRAWPLRPLYMDSELRSRVSVLVQATAKREGWLLSGVSIDRVSDKAVRLRYRSYLRGEDPVRCHDLHLESGTLHPCLQ